MKFNYREAFIQDGNELYLLAEDLATSFTLNKADFSQVFKQLLNDPNAEIIIAENKSGIIGYVLAFHHDTFYANGVVSYLEELYVNEDFRGNKIGKTLMEIIKEKAIERDSKLIALATRRASTFYKAIGYEDSAAYFKMTL